MPKYAKLAKKGAWMIPKITNANCTATIAPKKVVVPPTINARSRSPRRQTVIVASTKKARSSSKVA
jgi:hypothetical protein